MYLYWYKILFFFHIYPLGVNKEFLSCFFLIFSRRELWENQGSGEQFLFFQSQK